MYSNPGDKDTDGDGIIDYYRDHDYTKGDSIFNKDNRPLDKGVYFSDTDTIIIGDMTIVSCTNGLTGHAFLVYQSYINDTLDFSKLTAGFEYGTWELVDPCEYDIKPI